MKQKLAFICIVSVSFLTGCYKEREPVSGNTPAPSVTIGDVKSDASKALNTASEYSSEQKKKMIQKWQEQLSTMDSQMEEIKKKGDQLTADAKDNWNKKMTSLESKRQAAKDKITEMENSTAEAWGDIEKGAVAAWDDLKNAFQDASKDFERKN
jgi:chromosome segregation ATPase